MKVNICLFVTICTTQGPFCFVEIGIFGNNNKIRSVDGFCYRLSWALLVLLRRGSLV